MLILLVGPMSLVAFYPPAASAFEVVKSDVFYALSLMALAAWLLDRWNLGAMRSGREERRELLLPVAVFVLTGVVHGVLADGTAKILSLLDLACGAACVIVIVHLTSREKDRALALLTIAAAVTGAYAVWEHHAGSPIKWELPFAGNAPIATYGNPLFMADALVVALPYAVLRAAGDRGLGGAWWALAAATLWYALVLSQGHGALFGAVCGLGALAVLGRRWRLRPAVGPGRVRWRALVLAGAGAVLLGVHTFPNPANPHGVDLIREAAQLAARASKGGDGRRLIWEATGRMARDRPVWGWGPGALQDRFTAYQGVLLHRAEFSALPYRMTRHGHNDYLQLAAERGGVGLGLFIWLLLTWFAGIQRGLAGGGIAGRVGLPLAAGMVAWLVDALANGPFSMPPSRHLVWLILALGWPCQDRSIEVTAIRSDDDLRFIGRGIAAYALMLFMVRPFVRDLLSEQYAREATATFASASPYRSHALLLRAQLLALEDRRHEFLIGNALMSQGRFAGAARAYERDLERNSHFASSWCNLGLARLTLGKPREALEALLAAERLAPAEPEVLGYLAGALAANGRGSEALAVWKRALKAGYAGPKAREIERLVMAAGQGRRGDPR